MALRFNPPPNWPAPPEGFNPSPGWQPDPEWGPAPEGWPLWVEDSVPGETIGPTSAPQAASGADPAWAPTQAVSTGPTGQSPVADPTGQSASAPSGDYASSGPIVPSGPGPMTSSGPGPGVGPMAPSGPGADPYSTGANYAQSPTPYQNQGGFPGAGAPAGAGWQPYNGMQTTQTPVYKRPVFWIPCVAVALVLVLTVVFLLIRDGSSSGSNTAGPTTAGGSAPASGASAAGGLGMTKENPADPDEYQLTFENPTSAGDKVDISLGTVLWDGNSSMKAAQTFYEEPDPGKVYVRVPVSVTYTGSGQYSAYGMSMDYVAPDGSSVEAESFTIAKDDLTMQNMPYSGGSATGYVTFQLTTEQAKAKDGVWAVKGFYSSDPMFMKAK